MTDPKKQGESTVENVSENAGLAPAPAPEQSIETRPETGKRMGLREWKWTKKKRKAIRLILRGWEHGKIAESLSIHRSTLTRWRKNQEFSAELMTKAREYMETRRFKRTHETGVIADQLAGLTAKRLSDAIRSGGDPDQRELNQLQLFMREYRAFKESEKIDFGDDPRGGGVSVNIGIGVSGGASSDATSQSFRAFVEEHLDKVPDNVIVNADTPQEMLLGIAETLVESTDMLDDMYEEDKAAAARAEADKK